MHIPKTEDVREEKTKPKKINSAEKNRHKEGLKNFEKFPLSNEPNTQEIISTAKTIEVLSRVQENSFSRGRTIMDHA
jgi:hypothetical protein